MTLTLLILLSALFAFDVYSTGEGWRIGAVEANPALAWLNRLPMHARYWVLLAVKAAVIAVLWWRFTLGDFDAWTGQGLLAGLDAGYCWLAVSNFRAYRRQQEINRKG